MVVGVRVLMTEKSRGTIALFCLGKAKRLTKAGVGKSW